MSLPERIKDGSPEAAPPVAPSQRLPEGAHTSFSSSQEKCVLCKAKTIWTPDTPLPICAPGSNARGKPVWAGEHCGLSCMELSCSTSSRDTSSPLRAGTHSFPWTRCLFHISLNLLVLQIYRVRAGELLPGTAQRLRQSHLQQEPVESSRRGFGSHHASPLRMVPPRSGRSS